MRGFFSLSRVVGVFLATVFLASCSGINLPFFDKEDNGPKLEGLTPLASSGLSTTKDIRVDVVEVLMDLHDVKILKKYIEKLDVGEEANWINKYTGNAFTVRALEALPEEEQEEPSRKVVVWGKKKGGEKTLVKTYRYYF